jgi:hypothetical protein
MPDISLDQIADMLSHCLVFCQMPHWENYKYKFFSIILCTVANIKEDNNSEATQPKPAGNQTEFASGKRVLTISKADDIQMVQPSEGFSGIGQGGEARKRRLSSDKKSELIQKALIRARPLLVLDESCRFSQEKMGRKAPWDHWPIRGPNAKTGRLSKETDG